MTITTVDFNAFATGTVIDDELEALGITVSAFGGSNQAMIFDTAHPTGGDTDLATDNLGKALIISEDGDICDPDDEAHGGTLRFDFASPVSAQGLTLLDVERETRLKFYDADGALIEEIVIPGGVYGDNEQVALDFDVPGTARLDVVLGGSGAIDNLRFVATASPDGIVEGTGGDDVIDIGYLGDPDGDVVDGGDAILPGEGPDDDIILAGAGNDTVYGRDGDDDIRGERGNDTLYGNEGDDDIRGGQGNDSIFGGAGADSVRGGSGNDTIDTSSGEKLPDLGYPGLYPADTDPFDDRDTVYGGAGNDTIITGDDEDFIRGGTGNDTIDAGVDADDIDGGSGDDRIVGGEGSDTILGGDGNDTIYAGIDPDLGLPDNLDIPDDGSGAFGPDLVPDNGKDFVDGGAGNDTIFGQDDDDTLLGGSGNDTIDGGIDDDIIDGGTGRDVIIGGQGADTLSGGDDQDIFMADPNGSPETGEMIGDTVDGGSGGADFDILDLTGVTPDGLTKKVTITGPDSNGNGFDGFVTWTDGDGDVVGTLEFEEIEYIIPCFTPGTRIATPVGEVAVEDIRVGDRIVTRDNGMQEVKWVGAHPLTARDMEADPSLCPVLIRRGALGHGLPERDMIVSPQHRVLIANEQTELFFEDREVLVAAKHLIGLRGVERLGPTETTYIHILFERHEVVLSDGAWTESFQPGDYTLGGMATETRDEILKLFPELGHAGGEATFVAARRALKRKEASLLWD